MKNQVTVKNIYTVSFVSQYSGLSAAVIRIWEKRYQAVNPVRSASNRRLYSEADLLRLQLLKKAVDSGHRISQVANLPADEIAAAVISTDARAAALSLTFSVDQCQLVKEVKKLRHLLREDITFFIGGQGAPSIINEIDNDHVHLLVDLEGFSVALDNLLRCGLKQRVVN